MADLTWPETLPLPLQAKYSVADAPNLQRTQMEVGPDRVTQVSKSFVSNIAVAWLFTLDQMPTFRGFFDNEINSGADWFSAEMDTGSGIRAHRVRFTTYPTMSRDGNNYLITAALETEDRDIVWGMQ